jgi:hypothetical protein
MIHGTPRHRRAAVLFCNKQFSDNLLNTSQKAVFLITILRNKKQK